MSKPLGYVEVNSEELIEACKIATAYAKKKINEMKEKREKDIEEYKKVPWYKFWVDNPIGGWGEYCYFCWREEKIIEEAKLLTFAAHQAKTVLVSVETLNLIGDL